jgi:hypothetical protein
MITSQSVPWFAIAVYAKKGVCVKEREREREREREGEGEREREKKRERQREIIWRNSSIINSRNPLTSPSQYTSKKIFTNQYFLKACNYYNIIIKI